MMVLLARIFLSLIFGIAGLTKLADLPGSRQAVRNFGVPERLSHPFGALLPLAEIATALALLFSESAWVAGLSAVALLSLFIIGISFNLARGRTPDCHCFGQLHSAPVGRATLLRNALLLVLAMFVVLQGQENVGSGVLDWLSLLTPFQLIALTVAIVLAGVTAFEGWFLLHLLRQNGRLLLRIEALEIVLAGERDGVNPDSAIAALDQAPKPTPAAIPTAGLPIGALAPAFSLPDLNGQATTLDRLRAFGKPVMLIFIDPGCGPCTALLPEISQWQQEHGSTMTLALISRDNVQRNRAKIGEHKLDHVLLQQNGEIAEAYQIVGTPGAVVISSDGRIVSAPAMGAPAIRELVTRAASGTAVKIAPSQADGARNGANGNGSHPRTASAHPTYWVGDKAPPVKLPDLQGKLIDLQAFRGNSTLLLFWNPACGFCQRMLPELKALETNASEESPRLLLVSTGTTEANQALGLRSPIVLEQAFTIGHQFGAHGTPSAILIDSDGKIASEVAVGAPAVLALAKEPTAAYSI